MPIYRMTGYSGCLNRRANRATSFSPYNSGWRRHPPSVSYFLRSTATFSLGTEAARPGRRRGNQRCDARFGVCQ